MIIENKNGRISQLGTITEPHKSGNGSLALTITRANKKQRREEMPHVSKDTLG